MTREEAIDIVREMKLSPGKDAELIIALHTLIPELAESEDERIRKIIIKHFEEIANKNEQSWINLDIPYILAYLEKHKEQKEIPLMNGDADLYFDNWIQHNDTTKRGCFEEGIRYAQRLQKEQKPDIEICPHSIRSKSYKENGYPIENCDYGLEIAENILEKTLGKVEGFQTDDGIREHQTAIQAVRDAMKEQKPAEWSEEDKGALDMCLDAIPKAWKTKSGIFLTKWLEEHFSPRWKPSEEQVEMDLEKFTEKMNSWKARFNRSDDIPIKATMAFTARMFYMYPNVAREWYESLPKATQD